MNILVLQPLAAGGMTVSLAGEKKFGPQIAVPLRGDVVAAVARILGMKIKPDFIVVQIGVGSFSASRAALVLSSILAVIQGSKILYTKKDIATHAAVLRVVTARAKTNFSYAHPPHITT